MAVKKKIVNIYNVIAFIAMAFPLMVSFMKKDNTPNLIGIVISDEKAEFSISNWLNGVYQETADDYNDDHWAFKELSVRLNNQFYYDAFNQIRVNNFVSGKDGYVYSEGYIFSAFGDDLVKEEKVIDLLKKAKVVQDTLKKKGIDLLLVLAPGKGAMTKEFIEDKYVHTIKNTNYHLYASNAAQIGNNVLDLYSYFEKIKPDSKYPLFSRFGHHWSYFAECLAVDTIIHHIEKLHNTDLPDILWKTIELSDTARNRDSDVLKSMNLYSTPSKTMQLAYPAVQLEDDSVKNKTRVLTIADSYWYGPVYMGIGSYCFGDGQFWYYYNKVVPSPVAGEKIEVWEMDLKKEIESNQVIMLLYSDGNLPGFGNNFIYDAYELYTSPKTYYARNEKNKLVKSYIKQIRDAPLLLKKSTLKSKDLQITLDSAIRIDAMKMSGLIK